MTFQHFEHKADIGVRGFGATLEEAFSECARAMTGVITELKKVKADRQEVVEVSAPDEEALLVAFLNQLLFIKDTKKLIFSNFVIHISKKEGAFFLKAKALGTIINDKKHSFKIDVKAATYSELKVKKEGNGWVAQCIIDV